MFAAAASFGTCKLLTLPYTLGFLPLATIIWDPTDGVRFVRCRPPLDISLGMFSVFVVIKVIGTSLLPDPWWCVVQAHRGEHLGWCLFEGRARGIQNLSLREPLFGTVRSCREGTQSSRCRENAHSSCPFGPRYCVSCCALYCSRRSAYSP